jgi:hypothetical protein
LAQNELKAMRGMPLRLRLSERLGVLMERPNRHCGQHPYVLGNSRWHDIVRLKKSLCAIADEYKEVKVRPCVKAIRFSANRTQSQQSECIGAS